MPEQKFEAALEAVPDAIIIVNREREIVLVNTQAEQMFGYSRRELLGKPMEILVPEHLRTRHARDCRHFFEHPQVRPMETGTNISGVTKDGRQIPLDINLGPLRTPQEDLVIATVRDVTQHKKNHAL